MIEQRMIGRTAAMSLALLVATGCASAPTTKSAGLPPAGEPAEASYDATSEAEMPPAAPPGGFAMRKADLAIWNNPTFRRRFAESYLAETEIEPTVTIDERDIMLEVLELIAANQMAEAARLLEESRNNATTAVYDFTLANIYYQQEQLEKAAANYKIAVDKFPKFRRAWGNLGQIYYLQAEFEQAVTAFTRVVELGGSDPMTYGLLGVCHSKMNNYIAAESSFRMATMVDPVTLDWKMGLAESFFRQERYADAAALFGVLLAQYPNNPDLWMAQGEAYARLNKPMKAAQNFEFVDQLGASTVDSLNNLGDIYANVDLFDLAVSAYLRALERDPEAKIDRALRAAKFLNANGAHDQTRTIVEGIEGLRGENLSESERKDLLRIRAMLAVAQGAGDEEAKILEEIVELDPRDGHALILLGQHSSRSGDTEQAIFYFDQAAGIEEFEADAKLGKAQILVRQGKHQEALKLLRRSQELKPRDNVRDFIEQIDRLSKGK